MCETQVARAGQQASTGEPPVLFFDQRIGALQGGDTQKMFRYRICFAGECRLFNLETVACNKNTVDRQHISKRYESFPPYRIRRSAASEAERPPSIVPNCCNRRSGRARARIRFYPPFPS
mgnify:CR=1 FL=1